MQEIKEIFGSDKNFKVVLFQRSDGTFGFESMIFGGDDEPCWFPCGKYAECFASDLATAEAEARGRVDFLANGAN